MKKIVPFLVIALVVGGISFFGGMKYGLSKNKKADNFGFGNFEKMGGGNGNGMMRRNGGQNGGGFVNGEILSKDNNIMTVKMPDGGSKIIIFSTSTKVMKSADGSIDDLKIGENVMATGSTNSDGSITAQSVQLRPAMPNKK